MCAEYKIYVMRECDLSVMVSDEKWKLTAPELGWELVSYFRMVGISRQCLRIDL